MQASEADIGQMAAALTRVSAGVERARRRGAASALAVLQVVAAGKRVRPSEIAAGLDVHLSSVSRQVRALEDAGHVKVAADPDDRRSCFVTLTDAGRGEVHRLTRIGVGRFATFVADWDAEEVRTLGRLLAKLEGSIAEVRRREQHTGGRRWQEKS